MILEATAKISVTGDLNYCSELCLDLKKKGYHIAAVTMKRNWPYFWQKVYAVTLEMPLILDCNSATLTATDAEIKSLLK